MKTKYLFILLFGFGWMFLDSCSKDSEEPAPPPNLNYQTTPYQPGQLLTYAFIAGTDTMVKMRDEVIDYGFTGFPVLMLIHKETLIQEPGWGGVFYPVEKIRLDSVIHLWALEHNMNYNTVREKAYAARDLLDFIVVNNMDAGLFIHVILGPVTGKMAPVIDLVTRAKNNGKDPNDYLFRILDGKIPPERLLAGFKSVDQMFIISICLAAIIQTETWIRFAENSGPVSNAPENFASFLCSEDTVLAHYTGGTTFQSKDYKLSYDAGLWEAKCTYHVEGEYNDVNNTAAGCPGRFIKKCNVISTYVHVKGPDFIVDGQVGYSPAINMGSIDVPIAEMNGKVKVTYGDCCCFRKFSNMNFKINGGTGYTEDSFDPGK